MAQIKVTQVRSSIGTKPKQRGTLRARQDFGGVPRTHQFLITLMVHTTKLKPAGHATDHIGKINDEWPPRDSHPERRSTMDRAGWARSMSFGIRHARQSRLQQ